MSALPLDSKAPSSSSFKLESIPKIDKNHFISSFVDAQKLHAKLHAEEGRALWDNLETSHSRSQNENITGFSTPVLIPRNPKTPATNSLNEANPHKEVIPTRMTSPTKKTKPKPQKHSEPTPKELSNPKKVQITEKSKKRTEKAFDDDETAARLAERRDKKRAKREIVRPTADENNGDSDDGDSKRQAKGSGKKRTKAAATRNHAPGLALMLGFTATNLGKNRLTAPPPVLGVFNKGKASTKTQVRQKSSKVIKSTAFIESVFLGGTSKARESRPKSPSSDHSSSIEEDPTPASPTKLETKKSRQPPRKNDSRSSTLTSSPSLDEKTVSAPVRAESEVWDIERDEYRLPSTVSSFALEHQCSVVLPTHDFSWGKGNIEQARENTEPLANDQDMNSQVTSSLAPSQSASQHGLSGRVPNPGATSKYFISQQPQPVAAKLTAHDTTMPSNSPPPSPLAQASSQKHTPDYYIDKLPLPPRPDMQINDSFSLAQSPKDTSPAKRPYASPSYIAEEVWGDPLVFSDPVHLDDDVDIPYHDQQIYSEVLPYDVAYPHDFYIPPRVDAPPLLLDQFYDDNDDVANSVGSFDDDDCERIDYDGYEMAQEEYLDDHNFYDESGDFTFDPQHCVEYDDVQTVQGHDWQYETVEEYLAAEDDEAALFEMGIYETDIQESCSEMGAFSDVCMGSEVDDGEMGIEEIDVQESRSEMDWEVEEGISSFLQGRELLLGFASGRREASEWPGRVSFAEADVARNLKGHWLPQRL